MNLFSRVKKEDIEPRIITLDKPIKAVGLSIITSDKSVSTDIAKLGKQFEDFKRKNNINSRQGSWTFVAVSKNYNEESGTWEYFMGDVVEDFNDLPEGLKPMEILL